MAQPQTDMDETERRLSCMMLESPADADKPSLSLYAVRLHFQRAQMQEMLEILKDLNRDLSRSNGAREQPRF